MDLPIQDPKFLLSFALLMVGIGTDLSWQKYPNKFFLVSLGTAALFLLFLDGIGSWQVVLAQWGLAFVVFLPFYLMKGVAAGDVKLLIAVAPLMSSSEVIITILTSLFWAGLLGIFSVVLKKQLPALMNNLRGLILFRIRPAEATLSRIPYTVALLFGFLTSNVMGNHFGGWI